jgi:hypothetical protein
MSRTNPLFWCRQPAAKTWLGALLVAVFVLAEAFAVTHSYDAAAHPSDQACTVCVSAAGFGAAAVTASAHFEPLVAAQAVAISAFVVLFSAPPARRYARGPPLVSFTF